MKELFEKKQDWTDEEVFNIEYSMLKGIMGTRTIEAVEAAITYASYLNFTGITNGNYPVFLKVLTTRNHHVIDALLGTRDPFLFMSSIQPNYFIAATCFSILAKYRKGEIYPKTLGIILGVFQATYNSPLDGYRIYPATVADVNSLGKHLNKETGQDDPNNRCILDILDRHGSLAGTSNDPGKEQMARQANAIRTFFFDKRKKMEDVIPQVLLVKSDYVAKETAPRQIFVD